MIWETAASFVWRHWKLFLGGAVAAVLIMLLLIARGDARHYKALWQQEQASHALDLANIKAASLKAIADNITDVRAKEGDAATITENKQHDLESQLADARASAAAYASSVRRCPTAANPGSSSDAKVSPATSAPGSTDDAGVSVIPADDVRICAENTVKVRGWQDWYGQLRDRYNQPPTLTSAP